MTSYLPFQSLKAHLGGPGLFLAGAVPARREQGRSGSAPRHLVVPRSPASPPCA